MSNPELSDDFARGQKTRMSIGSQSEPEARDSPAPRLWFVRSVGFRRLLADRERAAGLLGRPADDWRPGRGGSGIGTSPDRLEREPDIRCHRI